MNKPELLNIRTPDFEFSIWASDISTRSATLKKTQQKRTLLNSDQPPLPIDVCFKPKVAVTVVDAIEMGPWQTASDKQATLNLTVPLFFENTSYQFEWVFFEAVSNACLTHRSQAINEAFRFSAESQTPRGLAPARLAGTINTGNHVGWMRLPLQFTLHGKTHTQHIAFEVLPTKMVLHQDLQAMYQAIDAVYPLWRFSLVQKTEQDADRSKQRGHFPLMWLANFETLRERFEQGLKIVSAAPHSRLQTTVAKVKAEKMKGRLPHKLAERVKQDLANGQHDKRYPVNKKRLSVDTPENRFIKMTVAHCKRQLAAFEAKLRASNQAPERQRLSDEFLNELNRWQKPLQKVLNQSFLKDVGSYDGLSQESLVLQQKTGYSTVYRAWQELKFYLDVFGKQSSISMKSVAEIYEVWCFLCLKEILEKELGFELVQNQSAKLVNNGFFEYQMKDGLAGAFKFKRSDKVTAKLAHEPKFTRDGKAIRSYLVAQEPDIVLEVTVPVQNSESQDNEHPSKQFVWLFDAKYRIKASKERLDDKTEEDIARHDYVPNDAINQMHRYRDALIRLSEPNKKSRPVFGAFALYPGFFDQANEPNPYADAIEEIGIGAFALLPSQHTSNHHENRWLIDYLKDQIGTIKDTEQTNEGEQATYPFAGMVKPLRVQDAMGTPYAISSPPKEEVLTKEEAPNPSSVVSERLYVKESARIPYHGMQQVLHPDLTLLVSMDKQSNSGQDELIIFPQNTQTCRVSKSLFSDAFKQHIAEEVRYLAFISTSNAESNARQADKLWPVKKVSTSFDANQENQSEQRYYLFELGKPLTLQNPINGHKTSSTDTEDSLAKLTTLSLLENVSNIGEVKQVYEGALTC